MLRVKFLKSYYVTSVDCKVHLKNLVLCNVHLSVEMLFTVGYGYPSSLIKAERFVEVIAPRIIKQEILGRLVVCILAKCI